MTVEDYFAYIQDYQRRLYEASLLARTGQADPADEDDADLDALYDDEDPFTVWDEPFLLLLPDSMAA